MLAESIQHYGRFDTSKSASQLRIELGFAQRQGNPTLTSADKMAICEELADQATVEWGADHLPQGIAIAPPLRFALPIAILIFVGLAAAGGAAGKMGADLWDVTKAATVKVLHRQRKKPEAYRLNPYVYIITASPLGSVALQLRVPPGVEPNDDPSVFEVPIAQSVAAYIRNEDKFALALAQAAQNSAIPEGSRVLAVKLLGKDMDEVSVQSVRSIDDLPMI